MACVGKADGIVGELAANAAVNKTALTVDGCATMGEKLTVPAGSDIVVGIAVRDPAGTNFSPYTFPNPSLLQVGINQPHEHAGARPHRPHRRPGLRLQDAGRARLLRRLAAPTPTGCTRTARRRVSRSVPDAAKNLTAALLRTFNGSGATPWSAVTSPVDGSTFLKMTFRIPAVAASQYFRLRGTNMPPAVPFETDASGNPLSDVFTNANDPTRLRIPCTTPHSASSQFDGCPDHLATASGTGNPIAGQPAVSFDVAAWSDVWFYANPIYIEVAGSTPVVGVK